MPKIVQSTNSLKKRIVLSTVSQVISQIFVAILGVITLKVITTSLGIKNYGVYATVLAFVTTFSLLTDLGLNAITAREIAKHPSEADDIISHNMGLRIALCFIMIPLILGLSYAFYPHAATQLRWGILLFSTYLFFDAMRSVSLAFYGAKVRNDIAAFNGALQQTLQLVFFIIAGILKWHLYGFIGAYLLANFIGAIAAVNSAKKQVTIMPKFNIKKWKNIITLSISLGLIQVINMMYLKADSILLSVLKGTTAVGIYGVAYSMILAFLALPSFIMSALVPSMATGTVNNVRKIVQKALNYMSVFACLLAVGGFLVRNDIVRVVASKSYSSAATPFAILALASAFTYLNNVFGFASVSLNKHHKIVYISIGSLLLNIVLNLFLIPRYSIAGAAWATVISEFISLIVIYIYFKRETGISVRWVKALLKPLVASVLTLVLVELLHFLWSSTFALIDLFAAGILILFFYGFILYFLHGLPEEVATFFEEHILKLTQKPK
jgi:O-antigen/teichoic acid export membrane protein